LMGSQLEAGLDTETVKRRETALQLGREMVKQ